MDNQFTRPQIDQIKQVRSSDNLNMIKLEMHVQYFHKDSFFTFLLYITYVTKLDEGFVVL